MLLYGKKVNTMDVSETIVIYDIKVCIRSQLNEYMKFYEYQSSTCEGNSLTLEQFTQIQYFQTSFSQ